MGDSEDAEVEDESYHAKRREELHRPLRVQT